MYYDKPVNKKTARLLHEVGYRENCRLYDWIKIGKNEKLIRKPFLDQAIDWIRRTADFHITIRPTISLSMREKGDWAFEIFLSHTRIIDSETMSWHYPDFKPKAYKTINTAKEAAIQTTIQVVCEYRG